MRSMSDNILNSDDINKRIEAARVDNELKTFESEKRIKRFMLVPTLLIVADLAISVLALLK